MGKQLTNVRLCVLPSSAVLSSLQQHIRVVPQPHGSHGTGDRQETCKRESSRALLKTPVLWAALGQPLFADINTHIKIMLCCIRRG